MEPVVPEEIEIWKWVVGIVIGGVSGAVTAAITISKWIFKLERVTENVGLLMTVTFKEKGGLNLLTEDRHVELCTNTMQFFEQDFGHLKEQIEDIKEKLDMVLNTANRAEDHAHELRALRSLMSEINDKLGKAWKMDKESQVGHS